MLAKAESDNKILMQLINHHKNAEEEVAKKAEVEQNNDDCS
jgi:hypothetical protein